MPRTIGELRGVHRRETLEPGVTLQLHWAAPPFNFSTGAVTVSSSAASTFRRRSLRGSRRHALG